MTEHAFDKEIEALDQQLRQMCAKLEAVRQRFLALTAKFLATWYWEATSAIVTEEPETTTKLGQQKLGRLKTEVTELQARAESIADEIVGPDLLWWHRQPAAQLYSVLNARLPSILETPLREAARALMPILQKYGYAQQRHAYRFYQLSFPQELLDEVNRYNALHPEGVELKQKLDSVKRAKAQSGAAELWKQA